MEIFETITAQAAAMRLPLYAVTLSAPSRPRAPLMLILHWHAFLRETPLKTPGLRPPPRPVAASALQIDVPWQQVETLDRAMLDAAWQLGAWELERSTHRPWWRLNAPARETLDCHRAFADYPDDQAGQASMVQAPDQAQMLAQAATRGYVRWLFRPRVAGVWQALDEDDVTLQAQGGRALPCPVSPWPFDRHRAERRLYRLGRGGRLVIFPKEIRK
ncbi:diguanylate cyclase [Orrella sp. JC864]|uniref:diguanylate cyclase n=1 Tax=Orrella sp. JC864 TaxID=3120298 RepID=UPI00300868EB